MDRAQERADKTAADLRRTETELRVTRVSTIVAFQIHWHLFASHYCREPICAEVAILLNITKKKNNILFKNEHQKNQATKL